MRPVWEEPRLLEEPPGARRPYRTRRWLERLRPPTDDPVASPVWSTIDADEQAELLRIAAGGGTSDVAHRAVVVAALQRQIERRESRLALTATVTAIAILTAFAMLEPEMWPTSSWGIFVAASGGGFIGGLPTLSAARRANERVARQGGHQVGHERRTVWGFDRPIVGDPLFGVSVVVTGFLWILGPTPESAPPIVATWLLLPATVVLVGLVLTTARGVVRRARRR